MEIKLDCEQVGEAIIDFINKELDTKVKAIDYPVVEIGKKSHELNFNTSVSIYIYREVDNG